MGLVLFLAGIGTRSGYGFISTFIKGGGITLFIVGAVITFTAAALHLLDRAPPAPHSHESSDRHGCRIVHPARSSGVCLGTGGQRSSQHRIFLGLPCCHDSQDSTCAGSPIIRHLDNVRNSRDKPRKMAEAWWNRQQVCSNKLSPQSQDPRYPCSWRYTGAALANY